MRLSTRLRLHLALTAVVALTTAFAASRVAQLLGIPGFAAWAISALALAPLVLWSATRIAGYVARAFTGLDDGLRAFRDADFSMRLAGAGEDDAGRVKGLYNEVADVLRAQRADIYQKELLLDTILQRTPIGVILLNPADRVVYSNAAARELLAGGGKLDGHRFAPILENLAAPIRDAIASSGDAIVTLPAPAAEYAQDETFHLSQRTFRLNTQEHRLLLFERLTAELRRQEVAVWKKAIRVINHELNNTIAPISSLFHSAKLAQAIPERRDLLGEIYETIEERLAFLRTFLESYAQFARLPAPKKERMQWEDVLADVRALYAFRVEGDPHAEAMIDRAQMQQVLINLVKNAHESGSDPDRIVVSIQRAPDGTILRVSDAGRGMAEEVLRQALVPFYTTRPNGSGLGLPLCNEIIDAHGGRMRLQGRAGEGVVVTCWVPG